MLYLLVSLILWATPSFATTYYVDPTDGLDANAGTAEGTAWKTMSKVGSASSGFVAGDIVKFRRGQVVVPDASTGTMTIAASGSLGNHITFTDYTKTGDAEGLALPIIDCGNVSITTWVEQTSNGLPGVWFNNYTGATLNGLFADRVWIPHASSLDTNMAEESFYWDDPDNNSGYPGTAFADGIYYKPAAGIDPNNLRMAKASNSQGVVVTDRSYLTFSNLHFKGGRRCLFGQASAAAIQHIHIEDSTFSECQSAVQFNAGAGGNTNDIYFDRNTVSAVGRGLYIGAQSDTGAQPTTNSRWMNNVISDVGAARWSTYNGPVDEEAISSQNSVNNVVYGNIVDGNGTADCIIFWANAAGPINDNVFIGNQCTDVLNGIVVGASVATVSLGGHRVSGNLIVNASVIAIKANISGTAANYITNNTVSGSGTSFYTQTSQSNWNFYNNVSLNPITYHASWGSTSTSKPDYNIYYPATGNVFAENSVAMDFAAFKTALTANGVTNPDANSLTSDPQFVNAADSNFSTKPGSPARRAGISGYLCIDVRGRACYPDSPDIGAYSMTSGDPAPARCRRVGASQSIMLDALGQEIKDSNGCPIYTP